MPVAFASSVPLTRSFFVLDSLPDDLHAWLDDLVAAGHLDPDTGLVLGVALQEWVANLIQHARWEQPPYVAVRIDHDGPALRCTVDDSSVGFDLDAALGERRESFTALPERGMGLMMLSAIAEDLHYTPLDACLYRLCFGIGGPDAPGIDFTHPGTTL